MMGLVDLERRPARRALIRFGLVLPAALAGLGGLSWWCWHAPAAAVGLWATAAVVALLFFAVRPLRLPIYLAWGHALHPLTWILSQCALRAVYYLIITPVGLLRRAAGSDPLTRRFDRRIDTYWVERKPSRELSRYFRQF